MRDGRAEQRVHHCTLRLSARQPIGKLMEFGVAANGLHRITAHLTRRRRGEVVPVSTIDEYGSTVNGGESKSHEVSYGSAGCEKHDPG